MLSPQPLKIFSRNFKQVFSVIIGKLPNMTVFFYWIIPAFGFPRLRFCMQMLHSKSISTTTTDNWWNFLQVFSVIIVCHIPSPIAVSCNFDWIMPPVFTKKITGYGFTCNFLIQSQFPQPSEMGNGCNHVFLIFLPFWTSDNNVSPLNL